MHYLEVTIRAQHTKTLERIQAVEDSTVDSDSKAERLALYFDVLATIEKHARKLNMTLPYRVTQ